VTSVEQPTDNGRRQSRRDGRWAAKRVLWNDSALPRVQSCGRVGVLPDGAARVRATGAGVDRRAGFAGVATCGSVWACPTCSARILAGRQAELAEAMGTWHDGGGRIALLTLTMRHRKGQALADLWDGVSHAWSKVTSGRAWVAAQQLHGSPVDRVVVQGKRRGETVTDRRIGWARVVETTHGRNGWHVHLHVALFVPAESTAASLADLAGRMYARWEGALRSRGFSAVADHGVDVKLWGGAGDPLADYFVKGTYSAPDAGDLEAAALELARGDLKHARGGNRTPFRILSDVVRLGLADDLALWHEWERGSKGRRQLTWSTGLRALLVAADERTDDELAADELGTADDDLVELPASSLRMLADLGLHALVLDVAERDDTGAGLRSYLTARGIPWADVRPGNGTPPGGL